MFSKTKMVLAAALVLGLASVAQAGSDNDADPSGGYRVGPLGQSFDGVNPVYHRSLRDSLGFAAAPQKLSTHKKATNR